MFIPKLTLAIVFAGAVSAQSCPSIPLCCKAVYDTPTSSANSTLSSDGISPSSAEVVFPFATGCVPIEDPPAQYILEW